MAKQTKKEFWIAQIDHHIYMLGNMFPREYYKNYILPKIKTENLRDLYFMYEEIDMMRDFEEQGMIRYNKQIEKEKAERIWKKAIKKKLKLTNSLISGREIRK